VIVGVFVAVWRCSAGYIYLAGPSPRLGCPTASDIVVERDAHNDQTQPPAFGVHIFIIPLCGSTRSGMLIICVQMEMMIFVLSALIRI
jgi:hypothetical protein